MQSILLDTCAVIWIAEGASLAEEGRSALEQAASDGLPTFISPITAWEVGQLVAKMRLQLTATPDRWFNAALSRATVSLAPLPPSLLIASSFLPGRPPRDPADRIVVATARDLGATLISRDRVLLAYGKQGHVSVVEC
jgi:PIN domain nuclease of toxin-antitoxin system